MDWDRAEILRSSTSYRRRDLGQGLLLWGYEYRNPKPIGHAGMATGLEIGVQLEGRWLHEGSMLGKRLFEAGTIHRINIGERFSASYEAAGAKGVQVGFVAHVTEMPEFAGAVGELRFHGNAGLKDPDLFAVCKRHYAEASQEAQGDELRRAVVSFIRRHADLVPLDALLTAKGELETYSDCELRVQHLAEVARMHPVTFARRFKRRFGVTPAHYRVNWRLHRAARLLYTQPSRRIADVASECGFHHTSYFHLLFRDRFGLAPAEWRRDRVQASSVS